MRDVRMRGFAERADVEEVERFLASVVRTLSDEAVPVQDCFDRVLARDLHSDVDVPAFARSAMDGFAVRGEDTFGATAFDPVTLSVRGISLPGRGFEGTVQPGEAVRIMTGAPLPEGADCVAMAEIAREQDGRVEIRDAVAPRKHVGALGEDIRRGDRVLRSGRRLRPQDAALLASIGQARVPVVRRPTVRLVVTGDELLSPGRRPEGVQIVDSNSVMLRALVARDGGETLPHALAPDREADVREALSVDDADVLLVSGGSSVGQEDHAPRLVAEIGSLDIHGIAMRPSSPTGIGRIGERLVFLLPGNPVSCLCAYEFFAGPSLRKMGGRPRAWPHPRLRLPLARKISSALGRTDYVRVAVENGHAVPLATSGASILSSTVRAEGVVIVPRDLEGMPDGQEVEILLYDRERVDLT